MSTKLSDAIKTVNRALITCGSLGALTFVSLPVVAQDAETIEEVQVLGIRGSLKAAIDTKREANAVVDAISAEDVGKFPDKNVAESLSRITGVAVSREYGEGEKITVRGSGPSVNRTLLNGQTVASADWFILDEPGRSFNYTLLPSVLVSGLEVYKSPMASIDEGSIGGTVIVKTNRPLELDANTVSVAVEGQYSEKAEQWDPQLSAQYSWKNEAESFGVLVSAVQQERSVLREGLEVLGWRGDDDGYLVPSHIGAAKFEQQRDRTSLFLSAQFAPTEELSFTFNALNSEMEAKNQNQNFLILPNNDRADVIANSGLTSGSVTQSSVEGTGDIFIDYINRISSTETESYDLSMDYETEAFSIHGVIGQTKASGGTLRETSWEYTNSNADYTYDLRSPGVTTDPLTTDAAAFGAGWIWGGEKPTSDEETYAQIDLDFPVEFGVVTNLKTGLKIREAERTQDRKVYSWHGPDTIDASLGGSYLDYVFATCPTLATCGLNDKGNVNIGAPMGGTLTQQIEQNRSAMEAMAFDSLNGVPADYAVSRELAQNWAVTEDITALYVQADFEAERYRGNLGLRYVETQQQSSGWEFSADSWGFYTLDRDWLTPAQMEWVSEDNDYSEVLPSLNVNYDLNDEMQLRFAAARVMARQNWNQLSPYSTYGSLNQADPKGQMGNPQLKPMLADQFDVSYEWYYADASLLAVTFFHKDIDSYLTSHVITEERYDVQTDSMVAVDFTQPLNGQGGSTDGVELSLQHDFGGFGVQANYTYVDANADMARDIATPGSGLVEGASEHMYNLTGYYENDTFGARLMYNYRTEWYKGLHFNGDELWNDSYGQWDLSASYNVTENISLVAEAINLTDEEVVEYNTSKERVMSIYENGRRFVLGARMSF
ncbi:TonB-dependent receptor [Simiduia litorea]|uniref:TonB-dependent receptor n=1 Tax=Simiduia litorea TaxID=1435348 RepID=UPI0036F1D0A3